MIGYTLIGAVLIAGFILARSKKVEIQHEQDLEGYHQLMCYEIHEHCAREERIRERLLKRMGDERLPLEERVGYAKEAGFKVKVEKDYFIVYK